MPWILFKQAAASGWKTTINRPSAQLLTRRTSGPSHYTIASQTHGLRYCFHPNAKYSVSGVEYLRWRPNDKLHKYVRRHRSRATLSYKRVHVPIPNRNGYIWCDNWRDRRDIDRHVYVCGPQKATIAFIYRQRSQRVFLNCWLTSSSLHPLIELRITVSASLASVRSCSILLPGPGGMQRSRQLWTQSCLLLFLHLFFYKFAPFFPHSLALRSMYWLSYQLLQLQISPLS